MDKHNSPRESRERHDDLRRPENGPAAGFPNRGREDVRSGVYDIVGDEMAQSPSFKDSMDAPSGSSRMEEGQDRMDTNGRALSQTIASRLRDIEDLAGRLSRLNLEHRVEDFRDWIPIWANIRSHSIATREGEIIDQIHGTMAVLRELATKSPVLALHLREFETVVGVFHAPKGFLKGMATILPGARLLHRQVTTPRAERLQQVAMKIRGEVENEQVPQLRRAA